jgi:peptidyl-prolyl cis-trans isomerase SurA
LLILSRQKLHCTWLGVTCRPNKMRLFKVLAAIILLAGTAHAQTKQSIDRVVAIVGNRVVLQSDVNQMYAEIAAQDPNLPDTIVCSIIESLLSRDLMCEQAERDSVQVQEEEVEGVMENRIRYFIAQYGSEERMEQITGKSVNQIKEDYRRLFKDQLLEQRMKGQLMNTVKVTPTEVRSFYDKIPKDSLPLYPSMVEVGQIVFTATADKEVEAYAKEQLVDAREQIISGKMDFATAAGIMSEDGSKDQGGDLGIVTRDQMVPEFTSAAFRLQNGEISNVVKSRYGFHLIQMVQRIGEKARLRHILIKPKITNADLAIASTKADSVRNLIVDKKLTYIEAVTKFTTDEGTKNNGGMFTNQNTGSSYMAVDELEPEVALAIANMKAGEYSAPMIFTDLRTNDKKVRIVYLKNITEPHQANLREDYSKIQEAATSEKQEKFISEWINDHISQFYIYIHPDYAECNTLAAWLKQKKN